MVLATVSINLILRENLIKKSQYATSEYEKGSQKEAEALNLFESEVDKLLSTIGKTNAEEWMLIDWGDNIYEVYYNGNSKSLTLESSIVKAERTIGIYNDEEDTTTYNKTGEITEIDLNNCEIVRLYKFDYVNTGSEEVIGPEIINLNGKILKNNIVFAENVREIRGLDGWTTFGSKCTFENYIYLENIELPDSLTKLSESDFKNCTSLKTIEIPSNVSNKLDWNVFAGCTNLKTIKVNRTLADAEATLGTSWIPSGATVTYNDQSKTY